MTDTALNLVMKRNGLSLRDNVSAPLPATSVAPQSKPTSTKVSVESKGTYFKKVDGKVHVKFQLPSELGETFDHTFEVFDGVFIHDAVQVGSRTIICTRGWGFADKVEHIYVKALNPDVNYNRAFECKLLLSLERAILSGQELVETPFGLKFIKYPEGKKVDTPEEAKAKEDMRNLFDSF